ncbi:MAG: NAD(P)H-dependent oxidoreductase [Candidatus Methylacidiphilales bacterium]|nr:NAD(P)H-dependent oxidoreductase [Candidatus Methylacidiphilales bacterium]
MKKLLHIEASPRKQRSHSLAAARQLIDLWRQSHPDGNVETLDLWSAELPPFNEAALDAKYAILHGLPHTDAEKAAWDIIAGYAAQLTSADAIVISTPMWNFSVPYILKHYFDLVIQPGLTFSYSPETGYTGLVAGKKAVVVYARGGAYGPGTGAEAYDLQTRTVRQLLGFIGVSDVTDVLVEPTLAPADVQEASRTALQPALAAAAASL